MAVVFSGATVAFHMLFGVILLRGLGAGGGSAEPTIGTESVALMVAGPAILYAVAQAVSRLPRSWWPGLGSGMWLVSAGVFGWLVMQPSLVDSIPAARQVTEAAWLAPAVVFGFLLCPYLDLTFHRAADGAREPRVAFTVFGLTFTVMIVMTCWVWFRPASGATVPLSVLLVHLAGQAVFTMAAHLREIRESPAAAVPGGQRGWWSVALPWGVGLGTRGGRGVVSGEGLYLRYLGVYGLVFPLYVWLAARPLAAWPAGGRWLVWAVLVVVQLPVYELAFVRHRPEGLALAVVVWVGTLAVGRRHARAAAVA